MTTNYISINSVLYDLSLTIDDRYWNQLKMSEWAHKALRLIRASDMLEAKMVYLAVTNHKTMLPPDLKYLTQITYTPNLYDFSCKDYEALTLPETSQLLCDFAIAGNFPFKAMRLSTNPFHGGICDQYAIPDCRDGCAETFSVSPNLVLTTTLCDGIIIVSYLGYPTDETGCALIPDDEELKEAILHYVLYRYWMTKYNMKEEGAEGRMQHYLRMWNTASKKAAGNLNLPDVNQLENLKNQWNKLVPRTNRFQSLFLNLSNREQLNF